MNIKEMEERTGMARANIRFYEEKGLLNPERGENGYRMYSQEDVRTLQRIRLLRSLDIPIEEIRALQTGEKQLSDALDSREKIWAARQEQARENQMICRELRAAGATYATLDAEKFLQERKAPAPPEPALEKDRQPYPFCPWRRFFARWLDGLLVGLLWSAILGVGFHVNITDRSALLTLLDTAAALILTLLIEPVLLHFFGTTPGKWIMGLRIEAEAGGRLSLADARARTRGVLWRGKGLSLPVYGLVRLWKSYRACADGEVASWDFENSVAYTFKPAAPWRNGLLAACAAMVIGLEVLCGSIAALPPCRGRLTIAQFARNYNFMLDFYGLQDTLRLDENAKWVERNDGVIIHMDGGGATPEWQFTLDEDGTIKEAGFHILREDGDASVGGAKNVALIAALAFLTAQPEVHALSRAPKRITAAMNGEGIAEQVDTSLYGVRVRYQCRQEGYILLPGMDFLFLENEDENFLTLDFTMTLEEM